ncbi:hypothetical protein PVAP13_1KG377605 [Panicum virgatum]|uniref:Uncharacterized protein n=1 Tax=Panicum virgatum TaxID=38727 RepID=A0A8T0XNQ0_PANVG|nr:hypothetical protein PVAP13_1KG377605 [Panicum virgatum]KAG2659706.1 hypothetical protein PVAP13_1KG377605 [Panicum virgatum]KAG2659707.1 hypothetical protein PVAP13_1KG377605 [Panicum virgatum]
MERGRGGRGRGGGGAPLQASLAFALRSGRAPLRPRSWGASRAHLQAPAAAPDRVDRRSSAPAVSVRGATTVFLFRWGRQWSSAGSRGWGKRGRRRSSVVEWAAEFGWRAQLLGSWWSLMPSAAALCGAVVARGTGVWQRCSSGAAPTTLLCNVSTSSSSPTALLQPCSVVGHQGRKGLGNYNKQENM